MATALVAIAVIDACARSVTSHSYSMTRLVHALVAVVFDINVIFSTSVTPAQLTIIIVNY